MSVRDASTETVVLGDVCLRVMRFDKVGDRVPGHAHDFSHAVIVCQGAVTLRQRLPMQENLNETRLDAVSYVSLAAGIEHDLIALEPDTTAICVHPNRSGKTWLEAIA